MVELKDFEKAEDYKKWYGDRSIFKEIKEWLLKL